MSELALKHWKLLVENIGKGDTTIFNDPMPKLAKGEYQGVGFHEAPRGTLSHWTVLKDGKIANYQAVVPSTWNAGPRAQRRQGPRPLREVAGRQPHRRSEAAARGAPHGPLVRSVPRLRHPHGGRRGPGDRPGEGAVSLVLR